MELRIKSNVSYLQTGRTRKAFDVYLVQEKKPNGRWKTIKGGETRTLEEAEKIKAAYLLTAQRVAEFNAKTLSLNWKVPTDYEVKRNE